jgi:hypothetical protein
MKREHDISWYRPYRNVVYVIPVSTEVTQQREILVMK